MPNIQGGFTLNFHWLLLEHKTHHEIKHQMRLNIPWAAEKGIEKCTNKLRIISMFKPSVVVAICIQFVSFDFVILLQKRTIELLALSNIKYHFKQGKSEIW